MAGRGTDIMLGGNAEFLAKSEMRRLDYPEELIAEATGFGETDDSEIIAARETFKTLEAKYKAEIAQEAEAVRQAGGLYIIGTERHESRRIDNQLRGRSGRQGDPGESRFFLSMEDDLLRLFGGDRMSAVMSTLKVDDMPIEVGILTKQVESAQKKVEGNHFATRRHVLSYDDVMNRQREVIYGQRDQVLRGEDMKKTISNMIEQSIEETVSFYCPSNVSSDEWQLAMLREKYLGWLTTKDDFKENNMTAEEIIDMLADRAHSIRDAKEEEYGAERMREVERFALLRCVDLQWMDHIDAVDELKKGIGLMAYGQKDPILAFREETADMFDAMITAIREMTVKMVLTIQIRSEEEIKREKVAEITATGSGDGSEKKQPVRSGKKIGPNEPCPCGSGKKYKKCCGSPEARNNQ